MEWYQFSPEGQQDGGWSAMSLNRGVIFLSLPFLNNLRYRFFRLSIIGKRRGKVLLTIVVASYCRVVLGNSAEEVHLRTFVEYNWMTRLSQTDPLNQNSCRCEFNHISAVFYNAFQHPWHLHCVVWLVRWDRKILLMRSKHGRRISRENWQGWNPW